MNDSASAQINPLETDIFLERTIMLRETQFWSRAALDDLQLRKLKRLVRHVERSVPFYRDFMRKEGFSWSDIRNLGDLKRFPLIDKQTIQDAYEAFLPDGIDRTGLMSRTTGGSTGTPLTVFADLAFHARDKANTEHYMNVFGLDIFRHRSIRLYGDAIPAELAARGQHWKMVDDRKLVMSCYAIARHTAPAYVEAIGSFAPTYIHTRPSAILPLARYILEDGLPLACPIRYVFCDGEYITAGQRRIIERAFQARLVNIYGHSEGCLVGHPCPFSDSLHFMPQVGILEFLDSAGHPVSGEGGRGELVATGFNNDIFPLIRYRTRDVGIMGGEACPCGRHYPILREVEGRMQDYVVDRHGALVPLAPAVFNYNDMDWRGIREFQVVQDRPGALHFLIQPEPDGWVTRSDSAETLDMVVRRLSAILGDGFTITAGLTDRIERTVLGKHRYLRQYLDLNDRLE